MLDKRSSETVERARRGAVPTDRAHDREQTGRKGFAQRQTRTAGRRDRRGRIPRGTGQGTGRDGQW